jgi:hypothetical protein
VDQPAVLYPERPRADIDGVVDRHWQTDRDATARSVVPVLVGREAAAEVRHHR